MSIIPLPVRAPDLRLCYVRVDVQDPRAARHFAEDVLGLETVDTDPDWALFRSDARHHSLALEVGTGDAIGVEVNDLDHAEQRLIATGFPVRPATDMECAHRHVRQALLTKDASGNAVELVVRPAHTAKRFFPRRDGGIQGLTAIAARSRDIAGDTRFWTEAMGARVSDWVGDITYLAFDEAAHHRIVLYPSSGRGVLYHAYAVSDFDALMRSHYVFADNQVEIVHGPGRESPSGDVFLRVRWPGEGIVALVVPANGRAVAERPRQFEHRSAALCDWGSRCETVPELAASAA